MSVALDAIYATAAALTSPLWLFRLLRTGKWKTDWPARFGRCGPVEDGAGPRLLIHAVSVGEVNAVRMLVEQLRASTDFRIVISTTTDTGLARARGLFEPAIRVERYPLDFSGSVRRFLDAVRPDVVALTELEIWPNFVAECHRREVPVCVVNGRLSRRSFGGYKLVAPFLKPTFGRLAAVGGQSGAIAGRFVALGTPAGRVNVLDTMKWDSAALADSVAGTDQLGTAMGIDRSRPVVVAGSTGPGEERMLIETCPPQGQLVLVPRRPERFDQVAALVGGMVRRSEHPDGSSRPVDGQECFLLDTMGELGKAYALADVAIVGRSFLGLYGSDMIEPIALGKPTIVGPHHSDFSHVMEALVAGQGVVVTDRPGQVAAELLADRARAARLASSGRSVILSRQGATACHVEMINRLLNGRTT